jgi:hypothetical protein
MFSRNWRDPNWIGIFSVQNGVDEATRVQRMVLFGKNEIDIKGKSILSLLVDEVMLCYKLPATMINISVGYSSFLHISNCQYPFVVP